METTKSHIVRTLDCGCEETRWAFGREITKAKLSCVWHGLWAPKRPGGEWAYKATDRAA